MAKYQETLTTQFFLEKNSRFLGFLGYIPAAPSTVERSDIAICQTSTLAVAATPQLRSRSWGRILAADPSFDAGTVRNLRQAPKIPETQRSWDPTKEIT